MCAVCVCECERSRAPLLCMCNCYRLPNKHIALSENCDCHRTSEQISKMLQRERKWEKSKMKSFGSPLRVSSISNESAWWRYNESKMKRITAHKNRRPINFTLIRFILLCWMFYTHSHSLSHKHTHTAGIASFDAARRAHIS